MSVPERLTNLLTPTVRGLGYELLGVEWSRSGRGTTIRVYIDFPTGVTVDDCSRVSEHVSDILDVEAPISGEYTLEVSSPGVDRPLFNIEQHRRFLGETIQIRLRELVSGRRKVTGALRQVDDAHITVDADGERFVIPFACVERSRLVPDWNVIGNRIGKHKRQ